MFGLKPFLGVLLVAAASLGIIGAVAANAPAEPLSAGCGLDPICQVREGTIQALRDVFTPLLLPIIAVLVALFVLPKFGWRGALLSLLVIGSIVLWFIGIPGVVPPLSQGRLWGS